MNADLKTFLELSIDCSITASTTIGGGDINDAERVDTDRGRFFVKHNRPELAVMFRREKSGLELLRSVSSLRIPEVVFCGCTADRSCLVLEWMEQRSRQADFDAALGRGLAALHLHVAREFGLGEDNFIGSLPQSNTATQSWCEFFGTHRIGAQLEIATGTGSLSSSTLANGWKLIEVLSRWIPDSPEASLLHGDLWGGNYMTGPEGEPVLIDPAVYYGHREIELAFTELFGGFSPVFYGAYNEVFPLDEAYSERRDLYNLYPLLVHANLFGGHYAARVDAVIREYLYV